MKNNYNEGNGGALLVLQLVGSRSLEGMCDETGGEVMSPLAEHRTQALCIPSLCNAAVSRGDVSYWLCQVSSAWGSTWVSILRVYTRTAESHRGSFPPFVL